MNVRALRVLVADDEPDVCQYLRRYLERRRFEVVCVYDGAEALKVIEGECFDFFLLDISMPHLTGLELIEAARRRCPDSKIVLISGFPTVTDETIKQFGGDAFIHKPIQLGEIDRILLKGEK